jgi:putative hemolysin
VFATNALITPVSDRRRFENFQAKIQVQVEMGPYLLKTIDTVDELFESFCLRGDVFNQEFRGLSDVGLDFDRFDDHFDHLVVVCKKDQKIIGTYRLNCSTFSKESYTATEFSLDGLNEYEGPYLELGRACIHRDYRKGSVVTLLWRGIAEYMKLSGAGTLFGCASLKILTGRSTALVLRYLLEKNHLASSKAFMPTPKYQMNDLTAWTLHYSSGLSRDQTDEAESLIPSLLKSYLKLGALVAPEPAFDEEFQCVDLLTILRKDDLANSLARKFNLNR